MYPLKYMSIWVQQDYLFQLRLKTGEMFGNPMKGMHIIPLKLWKSRSSSVLCKHSQYRQKRAQCKFWQYSVYMCLPSAISSPDVQGGKQWELYYLKSVNWMKNTSSLSTSTNSFISFRPELLTGQLFLLYLVWYKL